MKRRIELPRGAGFWLTLAGAGWVLGVWLLAVRRHEGFRSYLHDLGIFEHLIWNTARGHPFDSSIYPVNYLGIHFSPTLIVFVPPYLIWPDTRLLLLAQTVAIALGAVPLFLLARRWIGPGGPVGTAGLLALLNPYNLFLALTDFHPDALALPLLGAAFYGFETSRRRLGLAATALLVLVREDYALAAAGLGLYLLGRRADRRLGLAVFAGALLYLGLMIGWVIPAISGRPYGFADLNPELGAGPFGLITGILTNPAATLAHLVSTPRPEYAVWLIGPLAGLPLLRPRHLLPGAPLLLRNLLAAHPSRVWINRHYQAAVLPAFVLAAIAALAWLPRPWARRLGAVALAATLAFNAYALIGLIGSGEIPLRPAPRDTAYREALARVPAEAAVAAGNRIGSHLAARRSLWFFPADGDLLADPSAAEWVVIDLADRAAWLREQSEEDLEARLRATYPPDRYADVYREGSVLVLRRRPA